MRIKLSNWDACIDDCLQAITLNSSSMKGYYYLSQAQLALKHPNEALSSALTAYEYCLKLQSSSTQAVAELVLRAKKDKWEVKEKERLRLRSSLLAELEERLVRRGKEEVEGIRERMETGHMGQLEGNEEVEEIEVGTKRKVEEIRSVFAIADPENLKRRVSLIFHLSNLLPAFLFFTCYVFHSQPLTFSLFGSS